MLLISAILAGVAYRLRGWGKFLSGTFERRLFWSCIVAAIFALNNLDPRLPSLAAFIGMLIPHGKVYEVRTKLQALGMFIVGSTRFALLSLVSLPLVLLSGLLQTLSYRIGTVAYDKRYVKDPLLISEPLVGVFGYGLVIWLLAKGNM